MDMLKVCEHCKKCHEEPFYGYIGFVDKDDYECPICRNQMKDTNITIDEYQIIDNISDDISFLEAMIDLKKKDPIEYQLKLNQFKAQVKQQEQVQEAKKESNTPKCPTCGSIDLSKISGMKKAAKVGFFGIFGAGDLGKTWKCNNCGSKW